MKKPESKRGGPTFKVGERMRVTVDAPSEYRQRAGFITEVGPGKSEYRIEFDDGRQPTTGSLSTPTPTCRRRCSRRQRGNWAHFSTADSHSQSEPPNVVVNYFFGEEGSALATFSTTRTDSRKE